MTSPSSPPAPATASSIQRRSATTSPSGSRTTGVLTSSPRSPSIALRASRRDPSAARRRSVYAQVGSWPRARRRAMYAAASALRDDGFAAVDVDDDGVGFDAATAPRGIGLRNLVERAAAMNGMLA